VNQEIQKQELQIKGADGRSITLDLTVPKSKTPVPVMVFCHGFKGFKDWGHFNWMAEEMAKQGLAVLKFNFSHNGVTPQNLNEITDLETFSLNNYSKELKDVKAVIDFIDKNAKEYKIDAFRISIVGHSRGGGIALLAGAEDKRITKIALWASLSDFEPFFRPETIEEWEKNGVVYAVNKRTGIKLPLKKQFYEDYIQNKDSLDILKAAKLLDKPLLILHGDEDESVPVTHAEALYQTVLHSIFIKSEGVGHTFTGKHPFDPETDVTEELEVLVENTFEFITDEPDEDELNITEE